MKAILVLFCTLASCILFGQTSSDEWKTRTGKDFAAIGISADDAAACTVSSSFADASSGIEYAYLQQTYQQLRVFNNIVTVAYKDGKLVHVSGRFVNNISLLNLSAAPSVEAATALQTSARHLYLRMPVAPQVSRNRFQAEHKLVFTTSGIAKRDIEAELLWVQDDSGSIHLAWNVSIDIAGSSDWWNVRVDARSGDVVNKDNWTVYERKPADVCGDASGKIERQVMQGNPFAGSSFNRALHRSSSWSPPNVESAQYLVVPFPYENRYLNPLAVETSPWLKAGAANKATTYGWHYDGSANYITTQGNNVIAYEDSLNKNQPGRMATSTTPPPALTFVFQPDFSRSPYEPANRNFNITNLFYWNNIAHDVFYQYGFDENAGNFQADNMGRGGAGRDAIQAEAQDGSGTNNANFLPAPDGTAGRMQMFLWSPASVLSVLAPAQITGEYGIMESRFTNNKLTKTGAVTGEVVFYDDPAGAAHLACDTTAAPLHSITGKVVLIYRGSCNFTNKFYAAQKWGATGVIIVNNVAGSIAFFGGDDNRIIIPGVMVSQEDGAKLAAQIGNGLRIRMNSTGINLDGDIDNSVITHEFAHGISTRLTGGRMNSSCLNNLEQGGEGWSDYFALMVTTKWANAQLTDGARPRPMATYVAGQPANGVGIRRFLYSTDLLVDTLNYASVAASTEVHDIGEVWCSALWDMTWNIIQHESKITGDIYNSSDNGGNVIALRLVIEGLKLQPCRPGFLDARNAILVADSLLYNNRHKCDIWKAFARRGMGVSASQGSYNDAGDQVPAFDVPSAILLGRSAVPAAVSLNQQTTTSITLTCQCALPASGYTVTDTIPAGFNYVSSTQGTLSGNVVRFSSISFRDLLESRTLGVTLLATGTPCAMVKPVNDNRDTDLTGGFIPGGGGFLGGTGWTSSAARVHSGARAWWAPDASLLTTFTLTSGAFTVNNLSILSFWHYFVTINQLDGGKVEISTNNGGTWIDASPYFLQNGYNTKIGSAGWTEPGTPVFSGTSYATGSINNGQFIQSLVNLSAFSGQTIRIRFRFIANGSLYTTGQTYEGWYVDDIAVTNGCGGISKLALAGSSKTDSLNIPFFITPAQTPLPLNPVSFVARQAGAGITLQWQNSEEAAVHDYAIEHSDDGRTWNALGTVRAGAGSNGAYTYVDEHPSAGKHNYYRIRITDNTGQYTYTIIRVITLYETGIASISPNPARTQAVIYFAGRVAGAELQLTDMTGRVLQRHRLAENAVTYTLHTEDLPAGTYLVKMQLGTSVVTRKLVVGR